jgi:hypothetical protein
MHIVIEVEHSMMETITHSSSGLGAADVRQSQLYRSMSCLCL